MKKLFKNNSERTMQNDYSVEYKGFLKRKKTYNVVVICVQIILLLSFIVVWDLLAKYNVINAFIFSSPTRIVKTLLSYNFLIDHALVSLNEAVISFLIATGLGLLIAILLWWNKFLRRVLEPYIIVLNSLPKIALGPIIIVWVGVGTGAIVVMAVLIMITITILSMLNNFITCDRNKVLLLESMDASKFQILTKLILPNSVPELLSVLKINVGLTWVGTIMGEYLVSRAGLGYMIIYGGQVFKLDLVMTSTVILCVLAALMYFAIALIEKIVKNSKKR